MVRPSRTIAGACLCGALQYEVQGGVHDLVHCHCSSCRKHHGAPFATVVSAPAQAVRWLRGEASLLEHASSAERVRRFCGTCGSIAPTPVGDRVLLPAGNLVGELGDVGGLHMFVGSKAPWHVIADALPQHLGAPPGRAVPEVVRPAEAPPEAAPPEAAPPEAAPPEAACHGSCACGRVAFSVRGAPSRWLQCHCSRCRRGRSAAHGSNAFYPAGQLEWRAGRDLVRTYQPPDAERFTLSFCVRCGGGAPVQRDQVPFALVPAGTFDGDPGARPQAHIHVASKAPWYTFADGLPRFEELPPA